MISNGGTVVKNQPDNAGDALSSLCSGRSPGVGNANLVQYSCLGNPMDSLILIYKSYLPLSFQPHYHFPPQPYFQKQAKAFKIAT